MLQSMTGFGRAQVSSEKADIQVEVKTLNAKQSDTYLKIPSFLYEKEIEIKRLLSQQLERGKITLVVEFTPKNADESLVQINQSLVANYYQQLQSVANQVGEAENKDLLRVAMTMPDVLIKQDTPEVLAERFQLLLPVLNEAVEACKNFRAQEGKALYKDLSIRIDNIQNYLSKVAENDPSRIAKMKERLKSQIAEWENSDAFDPNRFEQELIYYIEKLDITEEKVRLENHLHYFKETLNKQNQTQKGKKLGFISQEIGREINTIGSKANDAAIQRLVVNMKDELEKIKEQTLNVL